MSQTAPGTPTRPRSSATTGSDRLRWVLLLGWLAVAVAIPVTGNRVTSWEELRQAVASGDVTRVEVSPELGAADLVGADGVAQVQVRWRDGPWTRVAQVEQVQRPVAGSAADDAAGDGDEFAEDGLADDGFADDEFADDQFADDQGGGFFFRIGYDAKPLGASATVHGVPSAELGALRPGLDVRRTGSYDPELVRMLGLAVPSGIADAALVLGLVGLGILVLGQQPWRATKWAWFWVLALPFGPALFALLAGPVPLLPAPRDPGRRLTGGWSFLLVVLLSGVSIGF